MPGSKNQLSRYQVIDECLSGKKKYWTKKELIQRIEERTDIKISARTLDNDIHNMRYNAQLKFEAPIEFCKEYNGYYYTDPDYSIYKIPLNDTHLKAFEFATAVLGQFRNFGILNEFAGAVEKVLQVVSNLKSRNYDTSLSIIDFEKAPYYKGTDHLEALIDYIKDKKVVELVYKKFNSKTEKKHVIHPYLLKEYANRWYLLGWGESRKDLITFGLDRIVSVRAHEGEVQFFMPDDFHPEDYFKNTLGITYTKAPVEDIILSFSLNQAEYLKTQYLHSSQEILKEDNKEVIIKLRLVPNYELVSKILSYGKEVKVLAPESLRKQVGDVLKEAFAYYME
jgi:predicted DNA-binding transcriptional regulator YafY